jgi:hypothetical protein
LKLANKRLDEFKTAELNIVYPELKKLVESINNKNEKDT